jgi:uncharacterized phage protein gp47/JayE
LPNGATGGTDQENIEALRARVLEKRAADPSGGNLGDYVIKAKEVAGVTRAWAYENLMGPGTVTVRFVMDGKNNTIIPDDTEIKAVFDHIENWRPGTAQVFVVAPKLLPVGIVIGSLEPDTEAVRENIKKNLATVLFKNNPGQLVRKNDLDSAITAAEGEEDHILLEPTANIQPSVYEIPVLGEVTFA